MSCYQKNNSRHVKYLRTIVLLDSESNHTYKRIESESKRAAIEHVQIPLEQYRRPQRSTVKHGINRRLVFDYQRYVQQPFSLARSD